MILTLLHDILDRQAEVAPRRVALCQGNVAWSYEELQRRSHACAAWLRQLGVGRGDRVLVLAPHAAGTIPVLYAASRLGALYVVASDQLRPYVLDHVVRDCEPRVVLAGGEAPTVPLPPDVPAPVLRLDEMPVAVPTKPLLGRPCLPVDPVSLIYTSGSTAMPKAVVSTHRQVLFAATAIQSRLGYRHDDVVLCCLPLSFDYGLYQAFLACLAGARLVLGRARDAGPPLLGALRRHEVTVLPAVPSLVSALLMLVARAGRPPDKLRMVTNTGAALADRVVERLEALVPGVEVVSMFGLTECKRVSIMRAGERSGRPQSVGLPLPDTEVFVIDAGGCRLPPGQVGELIVRGENVMSGYWRAPQLSAERFRRDEFGAPLLHTGDFCRLDADGFVYFVGRRDEIYKQGGFRVSSAEVEAAATDIRGVVAAAALPPADGRGAVLFVSGEVTIPELRQALAERLEPVRLPEEYHVLDELPVQPSGKVDKPGLADRLLAQPLANAAVR